MKCLPCCCTSRRNSKNVHTRTIYFRWHLKNLHINECLVWNNLNYCVKFLLSDVVSLSLSLCGRLLPWNQITRWKWHIKSSYASCLLSLHNLQQSVLCSATHLLSFLSQISHNILTESPWVSNHYCVTFVTALNTLTRIFCIWVKTLLYFTPLNLRSCWCSLVCRSVGISSVSFKCGMQYAENQN